MANRKVQYPARITVPMARETRKKILELAAADNNRPPASWLRIQIEQLLEKMNGVKK